MPSRKTLRRAAAAALLCLAPLSGQRPAAAGDEPAESLQHGTFTTATFASAALKRTVPYGIYRPKGYDAEANRERRYPLVVWLHGMFEDHERFAARGGLRILDRLIGEGRVPELIFVTAEGSRSSFYVNGVKSGRWEDCIAVDLLEHLEQTYRLAPEHTQRVLMGVSMGGYGALKIALRHPQRFGVVAAHSAAVLPRDPAELDQRFPWLKRHGGGQRALGAVFGAPFDGAKWTAENLLQLAEQVDPAALAGLRIYFDCGDRDPYGFAAANSELHEILEAKGVPHTWRLVRGGEHGWQSGYNQEALPHSLAFVAAALAAGQGTAGLKGLLGPAGGRDRGGRDGGGR